MRGIGACVVVMLASCSSRATTTTTTTADPAAARPPAIQYFAVEGGISAREVATGVVTPVYRTPQVDIETWISCPQIRIKHAEDSITVPTDEFVGLRDDGKTLLLRRGATCGEGHGSFLVVVEDFLTGAPREHVAHAIRVIAAGGDQLWMADGTGVWLTGDRGDRWQELVVAAGPDGDDHGDDVIDLLVDRAVPGRALVLTQAHQEMGGGWYFGGGHVLITDDGGQHWRALPLPVSLPGAPGCDFGRSDGPLVASIDALDGSLDRLRLAAWCDDDDGRQVKVGLTTDDGGQRWLATTAPPTAARPRQLSVGDDRFDATDDGLWRTRGSDRRDVSPPFLPPYPADGDY